MNKKEILKKHYKDLGKKRWKGKTKDEKSAHMTMMVISRWEKRMKKAKKETIADNIFS